MNNKLGKNLIYQTVYQVLTVITPLITAPWVSRVLGADGLGVFSLTLTDATYFTLFAMLGIANFGCRRIAEVQNDKVERSKAFWNIYCIQLVMSCLMMILYGVYAFIIIKQNRFEAILQGIMVISCLIDVNWYFFGVEKFKVTVTRNIIVKIFTVIAVLVFVNKSTGVAGYIIVMALSTFISNLVLIPFLKNEIVFIHPSIVAVKEYMIPILLLFVPVLATSVFHVMDKSMLGRLGNTTQLGYYTNADKVINIPIGIINGLGTVYLPRITALKKEATKGAIKGVLQESLSIYSFVIMALAFGLASISKEFAPLFFGKGFDPCILLIIIFAPVLVVKSYSCFVRMNILIPFNQEKRYTIAVCCGALTNLVSNLIFIPLHGAVGAVFGTFLAELVVCIVQLIGIPVKFSFNEIIRETVPYLLFGLVMAFGIRAFALLNLSSLVKVVLEIALGALIYLSLCIVFRKKLRIAKFVDSLNNR